MAKDKSSKDKGSKKGKSNASDGKGQHNGKVLAGSKALPREHWKKQPDAHDYPAAADYLSLLFADAAVTRMVGALKKAPLTTRKAKDILRASQLPLLPVDNAHVAKDLGKVKSGTMLSPVLLVRGDGTRDVPLEIADGYHRVCASYHVDENADIPCRIAAAGGSSAATSRSSAAASGRSKAAASRSSAAATDRSKSAATPRRATAARRRTTKKA